MSACPTCGKEVDALRARNVKVRGIQVVAYCSPECLAAAGDSTATARPATPAQGVVKQGVAPDSGPVIEIRYEPVSGVVTSAKDERKTPPPTALAAPAAGALADVANQTGDKKADKPGDNADHKHTDSKAGDRKAGDKKADSKAGDKKAGDKKADSKAGDKKADNKADKTADKAGDHQAGDRQAGDRNAGAGDTRDAKPSGRPVLKIIEEAGGQPRDIKAPKNETPKGAEPAPEKVSPAKLSGAGALPAVSGRRASRQTLERDHSNVDQAEDWLDDEPANVAASRPDTELGEDAAPARQSGAKRALLWLLLLALLGGGGLLAYKYLYLDRGTAAPKPSTGSAGSGSGSAGSGSQPAVTPPAGSGSAKAEAELPIDQIRERALGVLRGYLVDNSPRVQRMAAAALARTGDQAAKDRLTAALDKDKLEEAGRLEVAYHLARANEKRGRDTIVASLTAPRRDDKLIAGRLLVQLGDVRAVNTLAAYLEVPQHRLGAAEWLARLGEPRAIKVLEQIRADANATPDDKARALIGLAYAGKPGLTDELRQLLSNTHFNAFAADALAQQHDETARPTLVAQLEVSSLRVGAARALRLLKPDGDQSPYVRSLLAALDDPAKQRDTEHIPIAEAILILIGPVEWAEHT